jgi:hypothetical protein
LILGDFLPTFTDYCTTTTTFRSLAAAPPQGKGGKIKETKGKCKLKGKINAKGAIIKLERVCEK